MFLSFLLFLRLRKDLEEAAIQQEATILSLKKKHQDAIAEMTEQIDQLNKMKGKIEKDKQHIMHEIADVRAATRGESLLQLLVGEMKSGDLA